MKVRLTREPLLAALQSRVGRGAGPLAKARAVERQA